MRPAEDRSRWKAIGQAVSSSKQIWTGHDK